MAIEVNGKELEYVQGETITALLKRMNYTFPLIVVKVNGGLVKKPVFETTTFDDGATIQIIHLISGG